MMKLKKGFTLIETLVVLIISASLLSLSLVMTHQLTLNRFKDFFFWKRFQNQFELSENTARRNHEAIYMEFTKHGPITFMPTGHKAKARVIEPPHNLMILKSRKIVINDDGHVNPDTIGWQLNKSTRLDQKFQFGWGIYVLDYKKT